MFLNKIIKIFYNIIICRDYENFITYFAMKEILFMPLKFYKR